MNIILKQPICDDSAWTAETFVNDHTWVYHLTQHDIDDVRPLCRAVHIPTADRGQRGSLRIVG